jgi:2-dehydropantoate 2-reductase
MAHGVVVLGEYLRPPQPRTHDLAALFQSAGVTCKVTDNLERAHWEKLVWNVPFNGLGVAGVAGYEALASPETFNVQRSTFNSQSPAVLTTDKLLGDARWEKTVRELMLEIISIAAALGYQIPASFAEKQIERTRTMGAYKASTLVDFERGLPLELESLFLQPLHHAEKAGVRAPRLKAMCEVLSRLDPARR